MNNIISYFHDRSAVCLKKNRFVQISFSNYCFDFFHKVFGAVFLLLVHAELDKIGNKNGD